MMNVGAARRRLSASGASPAAIFCLSSCGSAKVWGDWADSSYKTGPEAPIAGVRGLTGFERLGE